MRNLILLFVGLISVICYPSTLRADLQWVWVGEPSASNEIGVRFEFVVNEDVKKALVLATADNYCEVFLNGKKVTSSKDWAQIAAQDVSSQLLKGKNVLAILARNEGGPAGLIAQVHITTKEGKLVTFDSNSSWKGIANPTQAWQAPEFDDKKWGNVSTLGKIGDGNLPWSGSVSPEAFELAIPNGSSNEYMPRIAANAKVPAGFKIEKVFQVPRSMGSWVSLANDGRGGLIASDQEGAGLFRIQPGTDTVPTTVEKIPVEISGAQGLLWAFDSLYAVVNGGAKPGLHRLRDTDADGQLDHDEWCMPIDGGGEHGPHAVILSPDGKSLYVASGNHTKLPSQIAGSRIPMNWKEDNLLPRRWDANGHAAGILAPGGWICNVDPTGKEWTVHSIGYRNQYDIAFNPDGELFTYDADMEWDFGSPWYRPTRVCHATSGSEFGWRSGTGKWPTYYEDSLPPAVDIGPGSPTGTVFGTGAKFPSKYQKSLFILDWTYSTIYAIDLQPDGSSYRGSKSDFVTGSPLPVTDAVVGSDGTFYFTAGGRGTQSALYRVSYVGTEPTAPISGNEKQGQDLRQLRHRLEASHGVPSQDLDFVLKHLSHEDRFLRYAARIALESQPVESWRDRVLAIKQPKGIIQSALALARQGKPSDLPAIVDRLSSLKLDSLAEADKLAWLRAYELAFARLGEPAEDTRQKLIQNFDSLYPAATYEVNAELVQLLTFLRSPTVVAKTLALMDNLGPEPIPDWGDLVRRNAGYGGTVESMMADMPPVRAIHFAFVLRNVKTGWTMEQRQKYFEFFPKAAKHPGGNSFAKFLMQFRDDAIATCSPAEQVVLSPITNVSLLAAPIAFTPAKGPGQKWSTQQALSTMAEGLKGRNFDQGKNLFHATSCAKCHRLAGEGGAIGPDLSTAGKKFSMQDMLDAIVEPSKAISDQYGSQQVLTSDGRVLVGRTVEIGDEYYVYLADAELKPITLKKDEVEEIKPSKVSQMPSGLVDVLNPEELKDLMAYLMSSGDRSSQFFQ